MTCADEKSRPSEDDQVQQAVLGLLLDAHPAQLSLEELVREMTDTPDDFARRDRIETAVRGLTGVGLIHRHGRFLFASRAAVRFNELSFCAGVARRQRRHSI
jgi:hypothetical protein